MVLLTILVVDVLAGVFFRYVLSNSLSWSGEVARYLCIWLSFIGSAILRFHKGHVGLEFLINLFPKSAQKLIMLFNNSLIFLFLIYAVFYGYELAQMQSYQRSSALLIPMTIPYASVPVGCALMALATFHHIIVDLGSIVHPLNQSEA